jgi:hypothetical protein
MSSDFSGKNVRSVFSEMERSNADRAKTGFQKNAEPQESEIKKGRENVRSLRSATDAEGNPSRKTPKTVGHIL